MDNLAVIKELGFVKDDGQEYDIDEILDVLDIETREIRGMFADYECAAMEVETKFKVLNLQFSSDSNRNPIETIKTRIKTMPSILRKLQKRNLPITIEAIEENLHDIAGVRVICSFIDDIYKLAEYISDQDDIEVIERKDYISKPKEGGYRSLHLIVRTPIFTQKGKKLINVEVQIRTIAMDFWASLEHKLRYKKQIDPDLLSQLSEELKICSKISDELDRTMQSIRERLEM
ncbi:RelA/SpoT domain protein [Peptostreptococcaceae bacterium AS15]|nr:RelA/SpoT domain protein [[Eubacterium] yurii subsp. margaretiae ATCC 43715]EJP26182.1 RelA/SpoT domain protein [Peptostreptococcaceae bacterium AS15]